MKKLLITLTMLLAVGSMNAMNRQRSQDDNQKTTGEKFFSLIDTGWNYLSNSFEDTLIADAGSLALKGSWSFAKDLPSILGTIVALEATVFSGEKGLTFVKYVTDNQESVWNLMTNRHTLVIGLALGIKYAYPAIKSIWEAKKSRNKKISESELEFPNSKQLNDNHENKDTEENNLCSTNQTSLYNFSGAQNNNE